MIRVSRHGAPDTAWVPPQSSGDMPGYIVLLFWDALLSADASLMKGPHTRGCRFDYGDRKP